jgi:hypothetical protein
MAYSPMLLTTDGAHGRRVQSAQGAQPGKPRVWTYMSDDAVATVRVTGYFSDAYYRGMRKGDLVWVIVTLAGDVTAVSMCPVLTCTAAAGADLANGTSITLTNSD